MKKKLWVFVIALTLVCTPLILHGASNELDTAVNRLNTNGLTQYTTATTFKATQSIRRDEAAKFFSVFAKNILKKADISVNSVCNKFSDVTSTNTMKSYIGDACSRGYILWNGNKFAPWASLSNEQAIAIIIRILDGKKYDESWPSRSSMYYQRAEYLWLSAGLSLSNKKGAISRWTLGILLYRAWQPAMTNTINSTLSDKPDLILDSVWLNSGYPSPKVNDEHFYVDFTVKNLGKAISFSSTTKWIFSCSNNGTELIHKEIVNWYIKQNGVFSVAWVTNTPNPSIYLFIAPDSNYTVNCSFQLQSITVQESNINNNSKSFSFAVSSSNANTSPVQSNNGTQGLDLGINQISINGNTPSLYDNKFFLTTVIKNVGNVNFSGDIAFTCEDYSIAEGQTLLYQHINNVSVNVGDTFTFNSEWLFSNFYNKWPSKTASCSIIVANDVNAVNNSYSYSFDTIEKNTWIWDLSLVLNSVDRVNKKINFTVSNIGSWSIPWSDVSCVIDWYPPIAINGIQNIVVSYQGNKNIVSPWASYSATFDLSQYTYDDIDHLTCTVGLGSTTPEASKSNNTISLYYKTQ